MPILVLSARTAESEKVAVLDMGADDYLTKPFVALRRKLEVVPAMPGHILTESGWGIGLYCRCLDLQRHFQESSARMTDMMLSVYRMRKYG